MSSVTETPAPRFMRYGRVSARGSLALFVPVARRMGAEGWVQRARAARRACSVRNESSLSCGRGASPSRRSTRGGVHCLRSVGPLACHLREREGAGEPAGEGASHAERQDKGLPQKFQARYRKAWGFSPPSSTALQRSSKPLRPRLDGTLVLRFEPDPFELVAKAEQVVYRRQFAIGDLAGGYPP